MQRTQPACQGEAPGCDYVQALAFQVFGSARRCNAVNNLRGRYVLAGIKDDCFDPFVLADVLRTDRLRQ